MYIDFSKGTSGGGGGTGGLKLQAIDEYINAITGGETPESGEFMEFEMTSEQYQQLKQIVTNQNVLPTYYGDIYGRNIDGDDFVLFNYYYEFNIDSVNLTLFLYNNFLNPENINNQNKVVSAALNELDGRIGNINDILTEING